MAIEGISSAVNASNAPSRQTTARQADTQVASVASQIKVETITPTEAGNNNGKNLWEDKDKDRAAVKSDGEIAPEKVKSAVDDLNKQIRSNIKHTNLSFKYHEDTNRISITVTDSDTDEVIREIPPEKALDMLAKAWEMAGLLVDEKR
ncbi:MAG: flagellar protein FlaG [Wujia sp.]